MHLNKTNNIGISVKTTMSCHRLLTLYIYEYLDIYGPDYTYIESVYL